MDTMWDAGESILGLHGIYSGIFREEPKVGKGMDTGDSGKGISIGK